MTFYNKFRIFCKDHIVLITCIPLIVGVHWSWSKLQDIPYLVPPEDKKDIPIITLYKSIKEKIVGETQHVKRNE